MTNDGNAILREVRTRAAAQNGRHLFSLRYAQVQHPAAKSMIEISRTQDEEVGEQWDNVCQYSSVYGTAAYCSVAGEMLSLSIP